MELIDEWIQEVVGEMPENQKENTTNVGSLLSDGRVWIGGGWSGG